jgi:hypothetical protein
MPGLEEEAASFEERAILKEGHVSFGETTEKRLGEDCFLSHIKTVLLTADASVE